MNLMGVQLLPTFTSSQVVPQQRRDYHGIVRRTVHRVPTKQRAVAFLRLVRLVRLVRVGVPRPPDPHLGTGRRPSPA
jgi:hypothetical protein